MNWEEIGALSTLGTLIVIAATAIAAVVQLRHMRTANTIAGYLGFMERWASPHAREIASHVFNGDLERKLADPAYREALASGNIDPVAHSEIQYLDFWESLGMLLKLGFFDEAAVMESGGPAAVRSWHRLMPVIALIRRGRGPTAYDNFEYIVSRSILWEASHPEGIFPRRTPHMPVIDPYPEDPSAHAP